MPGLKLTPEQAIAIFSDPRPGSVIAREFAVSKQLVSLIKLGRVWQLVTGASERPLLSREELVARRKASAAHRRSSRARWAKPGAKAEHAKVMAARWSTPELLARMSERVRAWWTPDRRTARSAQARRRREQIEEQT